MHARKDQGHGLDRSSYDVVERLLGREGKAGGVAGDDHGPRAWVPGAELILHHPGEQAPRGADLGDLLEEVHAAIDEDRNPGRKAVHVQPSFDELSYEVSDFHQAESHLFHSIQPGLAEEVGVLQEPVELRHLTGAELDAVQGEAKPEGHGHVSGIPAVLGVKGPLEDRATELGRGEAVLLCHEMETRHGQGRGQRGRNRDRLEGEALVQIPVILQAAQGDPLGSDRVDSEGVVRIQPGHGRAVADHVDSHLPLVDQILELPVRFVRIPFPGQLPVNPSPARARPLSPGERKRPGRVEILLVVEVSHVAGRVGRLERNP